MSKDNNHIYYYLFAIVQILYEHIFHPYKFTLLLQNNFGVDWF